MKMLVAIAVVVVPMAVTPAKVFAACSPGSGGLVSDVTNNIFVPWYKYLPSEDIAGKCTPQFPKKAGDSTDVTKGVTLVFIAIIELLTRVSALVAVAFIIYGSVQYITSQGDTQSIANAKSTITNAIIGFVITVLAIGIVQFLGRAVS